MLRFLVLDMVFAPFGVAVVFKSGEPGGDAHEKPTIVADDVVIRCRRYDAC
ncbi:MAG: hypothetical protein AAFX52_14020 [Pseudomonadota bacterium]